jgi:hypothetical protein
MGRRESLRPVSVRPLSRRVGAAASAAARSALTGTRARRTRLRSTRRRGPNRWSGANVVEDALDCASMWKLRRAGPIFDGTGEAVDTYSRAGSRRGSRRSGPHSRSDIPGSVDALCCDSTLMVLLRGASARGCEPWPRRIDPHAVLTGGAVIRPGSASRVGSVARGVDVRPVRPCDAGRGAGP